MPPRTPFVKPGAYFGREDRPSPIVAVAAILAVAAVTAATIYSSFRPLQRRYIRGLMPNLDTLGTETSLRVSLWGSVTVDVALTATAIVVGWLLFGAAISLVEGLADGDGEFARSLALTGEAHMAELALFPVRAVGLWILIQSSTDPTEFAAPIGAALVYWGTAPLAVVSVLGILWKGAIVGFGLELDAVRGVAVGVTLAAVTSPVLLMLVLEIV